MLNQILIKIFICCYDSISNGNVQNYCNTVRPSVCLSIKFMRQLNRSSYFLPTRHYASVSVVTVTETAAET